MKTRFARVAAVRRHLHRDWRRLGQRGGPWRAALPRRPGDGKGGKDDRARRGRRQGGRRGRATDHDHAWSGLGSLGNVAYDNGVSRRAERRSLQPVEGHEDQIHDQSRRKRPLCHRGRAAGETLMRARVRAAISQCRPCRCGASDSIDNPAARRARSTVSMAGMAGRASLISPPA